MEEWVINAEYGKCEFTRKSLMRKGLFREDPPIRLLGERVFPVTGKGKVSGS